MVKILSRMLDVCPSSFMTYKMQQHKHYKCVLFTVQYVFIIFNIPLYKVFKIICQNLRFLTKKLIVSMHTFIDLLMLKMVLLKLTTIIIYGFLTLTVFENSQKIRNSLTSLVTLLEIFIFFTHPLNTSSRVR